MQEINPFSFSILGNMALNLNTTVDKVVSNGFGLAFIAYPDALSKIGGDVVWCMIFFLMAFTLGLDSEMAYMETVITGLIDMFPNYLKPRRAKLIIGVIAGLFILGLLTCTRTGQNWVDVFDQSTGGWGILFTSTAEILIVGTWYGGGILGWLGYKEERLIQDIELMIGKKSNLFWFPWRLLWYVISPLLLIYLLIASLVIPKEVDPIQEAYVGATTLSTVVSWLVIISGFIFVPIMLGYTLWKNNWDLMKILSPSKSWGPYLEKHRVVEFGEIMPIAILKLLKPLRRDFL